MPKMKTHKGSKKRFRVTATGKLKRSQAGKKHLNSHKTGKRKRHLRAAVIEGGKLGKKYVGDGRRQGVRRGFELPSLARLRKFGQISGSIDR